MVGISAAVRNATGLSVGDCISVTLTVADTPRQVNVPDVLAAALTAHDGAARSSNSMRASGRTNPSDLDLLDVCLSLDPPP